MRHPLPGPEHGLLEPVHERLGPGKNALEHPYDDREKDQRTRDRMQENRVETARPERRGGRFVRSAHAKFSGPLAALRHILQNR